MAHSAVDKDHHISDDVLIARDREEADRFMLAWFGGFGISGLIILLALVAGVIYIATRL